MDSQEYTYNNPVFLQPVTEPVKYDDVQYQTYPVQEITSTQGGYEANPVTFNEYEVTNTYNTYNDQNNINGYSEGITSNQINPVYSFGEENQVNYINETNKIDITNTNAQYDAYNINSTDYSSYNQYDITNTSNNINSYTPVEEYPMTTNYQDNSNNIAYQTNEIYTENQINLENQVSFGENISNNIISQTNEIIQENPVTLEENFSNNIINQTNEVIQENPVTLGETFSNNIVSQTNEVIQENPVILGETFSNNIISQTNEVIQENPVTLGENISNNIISQTNEVIQENPITSADFSLANDKSGANQINEIYTGESSNMNVLNSIDTVHSIKRPELNEIAYSEFNYNNEPEHMTKKVPKKIDSPRLINPLISPIPPSPKLISKQDGEKVASNILTPDEKKLLNNNNGYDYEKDFDIKSHYDLTLIKEPFGFNYKIVHKVGIPLLGHFEMPQDCEYKSPLLSPNGKYLACIAHGPEDFVYVWEINDLYCYKYKFSSSRVDGISFTPESNSIIIVYRYSNPVMYDLSSGKKILEFEKNGEESNREGFQCSYTTTGTHFAYTTDKSFTLWSLRTGKIKQQIFDDSPIKIVSDEYLICINNELNVVIKNISTEEDLVTFRLKGVESPNEILDAKCTKDMTSFLYVIKQGIIRYIFNDKEYKGIQKFMYGVDKAKISDDCRYVLKTNMKNISIYDIEKQDSICTLLKEKFNEFRVDFINKKVIVIDEISIDIQSYEDDCAPEQYVWLDKNPTKFEDAKLSRDSKVLLARVNRNNAVAYDLKTGYIVKKWQNIDENWLDYAMTKYGGDNIAIKSHSILVKVWNFASGREKASFYGYDSYSFYFSGGGCYLACGTKVGKEIARIWDIYNQKYGIFKYDGTNNNFHTVVHLTIPEPLRLICCSVDQHPVVFNTHTRELLYTCECPYRLEEIYEIQSDLLYNVFLVKGKDERKRNVGIMYKLSDGALLETYENYTVLELAKNNGAIISKCENVNGGKLTSTNIKNLGDPILNDFQIQTEKCRLLDDNKSVVVEYGDQFNKEYNLLDVENGNFIGKISFTKKNRRNSATYLTVDPLKKELYFRYFEFLTPQETMIYKKKNIYNVEEENDK